ncbi:hypothetical protein DKAM_0897 [Desulfurococcus amylolyticus 1221n]|uniref:Uncharacterized protein n=1 Tax=Desulfurococcus amylolyticus (strain DSM 18924 / JCM 16383 / VKM B-2413 / 1221n) TaxID=490899 RepID=B8D542_DESA1|nr:hypothetical protein DKAM_0897 [Desulfurococcus amylolyticus 1221n]
MSQLITEYTIYKTAETVIIVKIIESMPGCIYLGGTPFSLATGLPPVFMGLLRLNHRILHGVFIL